MQIWFYMDSTSCGKAGLPVSHFVAISWPSSLHSVSSSEWWFNFSRGAGWRYSSLLELCAWYLTGLRRSQWEMAVTIMVKQNNTKSCITRNVFSLHGHTFLYSNTITLQHYRVYPEHVHCYIYKVVGLTIYDLSPLFCQGNPWGSMAPAERKCWVTHGVAWQPKW